MDAQKELDELRESTRQALMKSWAEVEALQGQKDMLEGRVMELEEELTQTLEREAEWQRMYEDLAEKQSSEERPEAGLSSFFNGKKATDNNNNNAGGASSGASVGGQSLGNFLGRSRKLMEGTSVSDEEELSEVQSTNLNKQRWGWKARREASTVTTTTVSSSMTTTTTSEDLQKQIQDFEKEKQELMVEWQIKLESRDTAIHSMEQTTQLQGQTLEELRNDLRDTHTEMMKMELDAEREIERLTKKLDEKRKYINKQHDRIQDYKDHIRDLTDQLEKYCRKGGEPSSSNGNNNNGNNTSSSSTSPSRYSSLRRTASRDMDRSQRNDGRSRRRMSGDHTSNFESQGSEKASKRGSGTEASIQSSATSSSRRDGGGGGRGAMRTERSERASTRSRERATLEHRRSSLDTFRAQKGALNLNPERRASGDCGRRSTDSRSTKSEKPFSEEAASCVSTN